MIIKFAAVKRKCRYGEGLELSLIIAFNGSLFQSIKHYYSVVYKQIDVWAMICFRETFCSFSCSKLTGLSYKQIIQNGKLFLKMKTESCPKKRIF